MKTKSQKLWLHSSDKTKSKDKPDFAKVNSLYNKLGLAGEFQRRPRLENSYFDTVGESDD